MLVEDNICIFHWGISEMSFLTIRGHVFLRFDSEFAGNFALD